MNINLHIENLVLDGLPVTAGQGKLIQVAVESELAHLLDVGGLPGVSAAAMKKISCGQIHLASESKPVQTGTQIARAAYSSLASLGTTSRATQAGGRRNA